MGMLILAIAKLENVIVNIILLDMSVRYPPGFYGNAMDGTPEAIKTCPCPDNGPCIEVSGNIQSPKCTECPEGRMGFRCQKCDCNQNVDKDAIGNCDDSTGECLRCIDNTD